MITKEQANEIIVKMAKAGYEDMFEDKWDSLPERAIERVIWVSIAEAMLKSVNFPAELYHVCQMLAMGKS